LGTTPFAHTVRFPVGKQVLTFVNGAFPRIEREFDISAQHSHLKVRLTDYVAMLDVKVKPWGEVFVDGERIGITPLEEPFFFSAGTHSLRITHSDLRSVEKSFDVSAGDTIAVQADLDDSTLTLRRIGAAIQ
jgi:hypothetical protein